MRYTIYHVFSIVNRIIVEIIGQMVQKRPMHIRSSWCRPQVDELPQLSLPFYPRSVGHFAVAGTYSEEVPAGVKPFVQLYWVISGELEFEFDGTRYKLGAGGVCYRLPGEPHIHRLLSGKAEYRWLTFDGKGAQEFIESFGFPRTGWHGGQCPDELFIEYEDRLHEMTPHCLRRMCSIITEVICRAGTAEENEDASLTLFRRAVAICRKNFQTADFNVNQLAKILQINRSTVNRHFIRHMGISAGKYLEQLKIQYASTQLQSTSKTLSEIAEMSGLHDAAYLCRIIKKHYGTTPSKLRK